MSTKPSKRQFVHQRLNLPRMEQLQEKTGPIQSQEEFTTKFNTMSPVEYGGYSGCSYRGGETGVVCTRNMNRYTPDSNFWTGNWVSNVDVQFPAPLLEVVGAEQVLNGGNTDYIGNVCTDDCACSYANPDCQCTTPTCGWVSVNHDCMGAVPNGKYSSLSACEAAQYPGYYGK